MKRYIYKLDNIKFILSEYGEVEALYNNLKINENNILVERYNPIELLQGNSQVTISFSRLDYRQKEIILQSINQRIIDNQKKSLVISAINQ